jgi:hypothetical protein
MALVQIAEAATGWRLDARRALTDAEAVYLIDNGLATGRRPVMAQRTRKEIIAEIMEWSATWGSPLSREQAEAKADQTIKATRPRWETWFIVSMIVAMLWVWFIASTIANF